MYSAEIVEHSSDPAFAIGHGARVVAWNKGAEAVLGYEAEAVIGSYCFEVLQAVLPGGEPLCSPSCKGSLCFGRGQPFAVPSCRARHRDGHWVPLILSTIAVPQSGRALSGESAAAVIFLRPEDGVPGRAAPEENIRVHTFGRFSLVVGGRAVPIHRWKRKQALILFQYLVASRNHAVHKEQLIDLLWPEVGDKQGRERLKVIVYALRQGLRKAGVHEEVIETIGRGYGLKRTSFWVDCETYEQLISQADSYERQGKIPQAIRCLEEAQSLYRGDYLDEELYTDWCAEERARLREIHLEMLARLAAHYAARQDCAKAAQTCRTALIFEPCREDVHRALMGYLIALGRPNQAIAQYHHCERLLEAELGVEPIAATKAIFEKITNPSANTPGRPSRRQS